MKRLMFVACLALVAIVFPLRAAAQPPAHADSKKATLTIYDELTVGTTVLRPGEYKVQCRTIEGKTFLIVTAQETGKEMARVACVRETLDAKVSESEFRTLKTSNGPRTLTVVRIKGEMAQHKIVVD